MERIFFTWQAWDEVDFLTLSFVDCTVVQPFGPFAVGDKLNQVLIDFGAGNISVDFGPDHAEWSGKLVLTVEAA